MSGISMVKTFGSAVLLAPMLVGCAGGTSGTGDSVAGETIEDEYAAILDVACDLEDAMRDQDQDRLDDITTVYGSTCEALWAEGKDCYFDIHDACVTSMWGEYEQGDSEAGVCGNWTFVQEGGSSFDQDFSLVIEREGSGWIITGGNQFDEGTCAYCQSDQEGC